MKVYSLTVAKNEADRYLVDMLKQVKEVADHSFFCDDQSTDETANWACDHALVVERPDNVPSFMEHEGRFRGWAWNMFEEIYRPTPKDWVLAIDADETLASTGDNCCLRCEVHKAIKLANSIGADSVLIPLDEVWGYDADGWPMLRMDGYWTGTKTTRLFRYIPGGAYKDVRMACGAEPTYVSQRKQSPHALGLRLVHWGYAHPDDQKAKYDRYTAVPTGHLSAHVQSINTAPRLERWPGKEIGLRRRAA